jgi:hypothetical protein
MGRLPSGSAMSGSSPRSSDITIVSADEPNNCKCRNWDIDLSDGGIYRIYYRLGSGDWFVEGVYD